MRMSERKRQELIEAERQAQEQHIADEMTDNLKEEYDLKAHLNCEDCFVILSLDGGNESAQDMERLDEILDSYTPEELARLDVIKYIDLGHDIVRVD